MTGPGVAHHDGSSLYVSDEAPALGDTLTVRLRTPRDAARAVHVWTTVDGEGHAVEAVRDGTSGGDDWWAADLPVRNTVTRYRFHVDAPDGGHWITGAGRVDWDPTHADDFRVVAAPPTPAWATGATAYQVFPDRFARARDDTPWPAWSEPAAWTDPVVEHGAGAMTQLYGGDLDGVTARLDHIQRLADVVYLTPVFPGRSNHRYDASTFDRVDPVLGGDAALTRLTAAAHRRGMRVIGDLTTNHCGATHDWFTAAVRDPSSPERAMFHTAGDGTFETWLGVATLPKFDHRSPELRRRLYGGRDSVAARWLTGEDGLDGWRIDVANMTGRCGAVDVHHEVARALRATVTEVRPDAYLVAEHTGDPTGDLDGLGWHGTMAYAAFRGPVLSWLGPTQRDGGLVARSMRAFVAAVPWRCTAASFTLVGSHDTPRLASVLDDRGLRDVAVGLQFAYPGIPMVHAGDELGLRGATVHRARRPLPWDDAHPDTRSLDLHRHLAALSRHHPALRRGGLRWIDTAPDTLTFLRETEGETLLVHAARARSTTTAALAVGDAEPLHGDAVLGRTAAGVRITSDGPTCSIWRVG